MIFEDIEQFLKEIPEYGRLLAIDFGEKKVGLATCDAMRMVSSPHSVYLRRNMSKDLGHLNKLAQEEQIVAFIMGFPLELSGEKGQMCENVLHFANKLNKKTNLNIYLQDERLSTVAVTKTMLEQNIGKTKRQTQDDKIAASYILQSTLDRIRGFENS